MDIRDILNLSLSVVFPLIFGLYMVFLYSGVIRPKFKDEVQEEKFDKHLEQSGKRNVSLGVMIICFGLYFLIRWAV